MTFVAAWGWLCALTGALSSLPQVVRLLRSRTSAGLSLLNWQLVFGSNIAWVSHGLLFGRANVVVTNVFVGAGAALITVLVARDRRLDLARVIGIIPVAVATICIATDLFLGTWVFGLVIGAPQMVGALCQLRDLVTVRALDGVSLGFLLLAVAAQSLWMSWAVLAHEQAVLVASGSMALLSGLNLLWYLLRGVGVPVLAARPAAGA